MRRLFNVLLVVSLLMLVITPTGRADEKTKKFQIPAAVASLDTLDCDTIFPESEEEMNALFTETLDSMAHSWYVTNFFLTDSIEVDLAGPHPSAIPDSVLIARLQNIPSEVSLPFNNVVRNYIEMYTARKRSQVEIMLGLSEFYFPVFEEIFDRYDLPLELKYLSIIESALNPRATSRVGAIGLWQIMYGTAKLLKLEVSTFVDERRDMLRSTDAAARYLKELYGIYQDWHLVIAAYNCGPGNVNKAIKRAGGKTDYWKIYNALPRETRNYVPAFIAATYVMNYFNEHQLTPRLPSHSIVTDTIQVNQYLNLKQVAANLEIELEELRDLNPVYRRDVIPAKPDKKYPLRLPQQFIASYLEREDTIAAHEREKFFPSNTLAIPESQTAGHFEPVDIKGKAKVQYTVKSGDNPGYIAGWFNVRLADLRYWNNINRNLIRAGQKLVVYVPEEKKEHYAKVNEMSFEAKQAMIGKTATPAAPPAPVADDANFVYYTVKNGDNLWTIAQKFPGTSNTEIMKLNNITDVRSLYPGQKLKIKPKA